MSLFPHVVSPIGAWRKIAEWLISRSHGDLNTRRVSYYVPCYLHHASPCGSDCCAEPCMVDIVFSCRAIDVCCQCKQPSADNASAPASTAPGNLLPNGLNNFHHSIWPEHNSLYMVDIWFPTQKANPFDCLFIYVKQHLLRTIVAIESGQRYCTRNAKAWCRIARGPANDASTPYLVAALLTTLTS